MRHVCIVATLIVASCLVGPPRGGAQAGPDVDTTDVVAQLEELNTTLKRLTVLVEALDRSVHASVLVQRIGVLSGQVTETQDRVSRAEASYAALEDEKLRLEASLDNLAQEAVRSADPRPAEEMERFLEAAEAELKLLKARLETERRRIVLLDNELADQKARLRSWESLADQSLQEP